MCYQFDWFEDFTAGMENMTVLKNPNKRFINRTINDYLQSAIAGLTHSYYHSPNPLRCIHLRFA
jgi:hypothetical protein